MRASRTYSQSSKHFSILFIFHPMYSKSQILFQKFNFAKRFNFLGKSKLSELKSANPQHFLECFTQIFFDNFSREIKVDNS